MFSLAINFSVQASETLTSHHAHAYDLMLFPADLGHKSWPHPVQAIEQSDQEPGGWRREGG